MGLALLPGFVATIATPKRAAWLSSGIFYACAALSLATVVIHLTIPPAPIQRHRAEHLDQRPQPGGSGPADPWGAAGLLPQPDFLPGSHLDRPVAHDRQTGQFLPQLGGDGADRLLPGAQLHPGLLAGAGHRL